MEVKYFNKTNEDYQDWLNNRYNSIGKSSEKSNRNMLEENTCLHCGSGVPGYCESCYQELIGINAKLQKENRPTATLTIKEEDLAKALNPMLDEVIRDVKQEYIEKQLIREKLAEAELKLKNYKAARQNNKPITTYVKIVKLISEIEIYKELLKEE